MNMKISIIIPVYNVEKYVSSCLHSVIRQMNEQIEVIIIDDGSSDNSKKICEDIISQCKANIILCSQSNAGLSATRNRGISLAKGDYIMFLDSDDELDSKAMSKLLESIRNYPTVDVFYYDAKTVDEINNGEHRNGYNRKDKMDGLTIYDSREYFKEYYVDSLIVSACLCLIKREVLTDNHIRFDEGRLYEDNVFSLNTLLCSKKVCYLPYDLYVRRYREKSITTRRISTKDIEDACYVIKRFLEINEIIMDMDSEIAFNSYITLIYKTYTWGNNMMLTAGLNLECMNQIKKEIVEVFLKCLDKFKGCSYYLFINFMTKGREYTFIDGNCVRNKLKDYYLKIFKLLNENKNKRIALYGRGKHTQILLEEYRYMMGNELQFSVYVDTFINDGVEEDGKKIVNIANIKEYTDVIVISSYEYRLEMIKKIRELELEVEILDFYEIEKMNMFGESLMF